MSLVTIIAPHETKFELCNRPFLKLAILLLYFLGKSLFFKRKLFEVAKLKFGFK